MLILKGFTQDFRLYGLSTLQTFNFTDFHFTIFIIHFRREGFFVLMYSWPAGPWAFALGYHNLSPTGF